MPANDIWSSLASKASTSNEPADWLIRQGAMLLGPMPTATLIDKLLKGELSPESLGAPDGSENFKLLGEIDQFKQYVEKAKEITLAKKRKQRLIVVAAFFVVLLGLGGGAVFAVKSLAPQPATPQNIGSGNASVIGQKGSKVSADDVGDLKLVALVDLDKAADGLKIREGKKKRIKTPRHGTQPDGKGEPEEEEGPVGCTLDQKVIFDVVKRALSQWRVCIEDLATAQPNDLPQSLHLSFTVTNTGELKDFEVINRELRRGPFRNCMFKYFSVMKFPTSKGSNCTIDDWPIPLKK